MEATTPSSPEGLRRSTRERRQVERLSTPAAFVSPSATYPPVEHSGTKVNDSSSWEAANSTPVVAKRRKLSATPSSVVVTYSDNPSPSKRKVLQLVTPSMHDEKKKRRRRRSSPRKDPQRPRHTLGGLAQEFTKMMEDVGFGTDVSLEYASDRLKVPKRRVYDVVNVLEGAGCVVRVEHNYRWIAPGQFSSTDDQAAKAQEVTDAIDVLKKEEEQVDTWIKRLQACKQHPKKDFYVTSRELKTILGKDTTFMAVCTPHESVTPCPKNDDDKYAFTVDPEEKGSVPRVYLLESPQFPMRQLSLTPPPPLLQKCCSDFSIEALEKGLGDVAKLGGLPLLRECSSLVLAHQEQQQSKMSSKEQGSHDMQSKMPPPPREHDMMPPPPPGGLFRSCSWDAQGSPTTLLQRESSGLMPLLQRESSFSNALLRETTIPMPTLESSLSSSYMPILDR